MVDGYAANQYPVSDSKPPVAGFDIEAGKPQRTEKTFWMDQSSQSDKEIIQSVIKGNKEDYGYLVSRYQQKIFSYLYRFLNENAHAAEDVAQTVFLKAYENLKRVDLTRSFQPWIYRIAHNEAANYLRTLSRKKESGFSDREWNKLTNTPTEETSESEENLRRVNQALKRIKPKYREALIFYYYEEKSYEEIATILETSTNTVGTLLRRARKQMQQMIEKMEKL